MKVRVRPWNDWRPDFYDSWLALRLTNPTLASPYFHPTFTGILARNCNNVEVAIIGDGRRLQAIFPFQRNRNIGLPVGNILSDYHGLICAPGFQCDLRDLLRECRLVAFDFDHVLPSQPFFDGFCRYREASPQIDLSRGWDAYCREQSVVKNEQGTIRRIEREIGPLRFVPYSNDENALRLLLKWKEQQFANTGAKNVFAQPWTANVLFDILQTQNEDFSGSLSLLYAGDRMVAGHFGMKTEHVWHYWFPAYDGSLSKFSPGTLLLLKIVEQAYNDGITTIDLGKGMQPYKKRFMNSLLDLGAGSVELPSWLSLKRRINRSTMASARGLISIARAGRAML